LKKWYHYALTTDGKTGKIYVDGEFIGERAENIELPKFTQVTVYLGAGNGIPAGGHRVEDATFDNVMIWDKALSKDEINAVKENRWLAVNPMDKLAITWSRIKM